MPWKDRMRWKWIGLLAACLSLAAAPAARAARILAEPLFCQFEDGYGVVAGEVAAASSVSKSGDHPQYIDVTSKVRSIVAQPTEGAPLVLRAGDPIKIRVSAGYACQVEDDPSDDFAAGRRYYLIVKHLHDNAYEHCDGASAMWRVERFTNSDRQFIDSVRQMAAVPGPRRLQRLIEVLGDPNASDRLRGQADAGLWPRLWLNRLSTVDREKTVKSLREIWKVPHSNLRFSLMYGFDRLLLVSDPSFGKSVDRADVW